MQMVFVIYYIYFIYIYLYICIYIYIHTCMHAYICIHICIYIYIYINIYYIYINIYYIYIPGYYLNSTSLIYINFLRWKKPWCCYFLNEVSSNASEGAIFEKYCLLNKNAPSEAWFNHAQHLVVGTSVTWPKALFWKILI